MNIKDQKPPTSPVTEDEVEQHIRAFFEHNYDLLRRESGQVLAEAGKREALTQALLYWRKLKAIATSVTDTEVKLSLPGQVTLKGRPFVIEGIVDIVREWNEVRMYDLKTHEEADVRAQRVLYEEQLNVYAHIWKGIRGQKLDGTAIIATRLPPNLRDALQSGDADAIREAIETWQPVVDLPYNDKDVKRTIADFGRCVDAIEEGEFAPPPPEQLSQPPQTRRRKDHGGTPASRAKSARTFAQIHCRNCDARFSCSSYRAYMQGEAGRSPGRQPTAERDEEMERELDAWIEENLEDL
jgi:hypothetical protein